MPPKENIKKLILPFVGKKHLQPLFEWMHFVSLVGMNYGIGVDKVEISGEKKMLKGIKKKLNPTADPLVCFDVGANKGDYSRLLIEIFGIENIYLHSFEPSTFTFNTLSANIQKNKNVLLNQLGLGDKTEKLLLYKDADGSGEASVYQRNLEGMNRQFGQTEEISLTTLDEYCSKNNIDSIDLLKIDVEGHELNVLKGAKNMLRAGKIKFIQFEFGGTNIDSHTNFKDFYYLFNPKYKIFRIISNGLREIKNYDDTKEIYLGINYLAELN